jgi:uncharacterized protein
MDTQIIESLQSQAASLLLYQSVLSGEVGQAFLNLLQTLRAGDTLSCLTAYSRWFYALAAQDQTWQDYLVMQLLEADNPFSQRAQRHPLADLPAALVTAAKHDLRALQNLFNCSADQISQWVHEIGAASPVPWSASHKTSLPAIYKTLRHTSDWADALEDLAAHYTRNGAGFFGQYHAARWQNGRFQGIAHADPIRVEELVGYETQRDVLLQNTEALLSGYPALHVLLYGSRGTGKSSLVKALLHQYGDRGLRLVEVSKSDLKELIVIVDELRELPQSFIIFVDDLSFEEDEDAYKVLKVVLEGNLTARPRNLVVYATSNRRHLIREFFGDRPRPSDADEVQAWDTVQEKLSFSDRFGLTLTFEPTNQTTYLAIVRHLAQQAEITLDAETLEFRALQWATRHNGRSGRSARQFIDFVLAEQCLNQHQP